VFYGESLGCGVAVELALRHPPEALILESPFTSTVDMAKLVFPFLPAGLLVRDRFDNLSKIGDVRSRLLVMHSPDDEVVPFSMGRALFEAAPEPKDFVKLRGSHNDGFLQAGDTYLNAVAAALGAHARS
ncbi:MAG: alpha/beta hydrolase, partial [Elusimicrobia bacterium]|nr:alpha/beta hydrolase [Elusimicrobiota bacterium]